MRIPLRRCFRWLILASSSVAVNAFALHAEGSTAPTFLYSFGGSSDGAYPQGNLVQGSDGAFYGTAPYGGSANGLNGSGVVFKVTATGAMTTLHTFASSGSDGYEPSPTVVEGSDGAFYGTTAGGGASDDGTVFKVTAAGAFSTLYTFTGGKDGLSPTGLTLGSDGYLYGTTNLGGTGGYGTFFKITTGGALTTLYSFTGGVDGAAPAAAPVLGSDGNFYGTTSYGGSGTAYAGYGTVYRVTSGGALTHVYSFTGGADGAYPTAALAPGSDGNFYGTTPLSATGSNHGTAFQVTPSGALTTLHAFNGTTDGDGPDAGLTLASDGNLYGVTYRDGLANTATCDGTIFNLTTSGTLTTLYTFNAATTGAGFAPHTRLAQGSDGLLYGTTVNGGTSDKGTVFQITPTGTTTTVSSGVLAFSESVYAASETDGTVTVTVARTGGSSGAVSVAYAATAGTAVAGEDFTAASGTLSWAAGDSASKTFTVAVLDDTASADAHTVLLTLSSPTGGAVLGSPASAVLNITDTASPVVTTPTVSMTVGGDGLAVQGGERGKIVFRRVSSDVSGDLVVSYQIKGSAVNGTDYVGSDGQALSGTATIPAGSSVYKLKIKALALPTTNKTVKLSLQPSSAGAYAVGASAKAKVVIVGSEAYSF